MKSVLTLQSIHGYIKHLQGREEQYNSEMINYVFGSICVIFGFSDT